MKRFNDIKISTNRGMEFEGLKCSLYADKLIDQ